MYRLDLFKEKKDPLSDYVPFARFTAIRVAGERCAICLNKDGSIMASFCYRGPDLDSSVEEELAILTNRLQAEIGSLRTNNILYFEAQRLPTTAYETTENFPDPVTRGMDAERAALFSSGAYFESRFFATLWHMPPKDRQEKLKEFIVEGREKKVTKSDDVFQNFVEKHYKLTKMMKNLGVEVEILDEDGLMTYLHSTVSVDNRPMKYPRVPFLIDKYMYDTPFYGGLEPQLGH